MIISPVSAALNPLSIDDVLSGGRDSSSSITETSSADNISSRWWTQLYLGQHHHKLSENIVSLSVGKPPSVHNNTDIPAALL